MAYAAFDLTGQVALITGGNGGIGLGMAKAVAQAGADVAIWGTNAAKNAAAKAELEKTGRQVLALEVDVGDEAAVAQGFAATLKALGRVDGCFANAGVSGRGGHTSFSDMPTRRTLPRLPLIGNAILNSTIGTATGWLVGQTPTVGYAMWLLWSGVSRCRPSQQLGAW